MNHNNSVSGNYDPLAKTAAFGNPGAGSLVQMQIPVTQNSRNQTAPTPLLTQQSQALRFPGHFQLSEPQAQPATLVQPHAHLQISGTKNNAGGVSSPAASTPVGTTPSLGSGSKRAPSHKAPSRHSGSSSSAHGQGGTTASPMKTMELTPAVRRMKRKLPDKQIPDKVASAMPESSLYTQMLELESRIDAVLARKKIDIMESLKNILRVPKILRIYVFNTHSNQVGAVTEKKSAEPPSWSLKIIGRILEDEIDPVALGLLHRSSSPYPKFSSFFKKITIYLDQNLYPDNHVVLWDSSRSPTLHEGFEVKRRGDKEFTAIVRLEMDFVPERFKLAPALQQVLGIEVETRPKIIAALWHYIKTRKLQIPGDTSSFMCDPPLRNVFGEEKLKFAAVAQKITDHLASPKPVHLEHKIKLSGNCPAGNTCYDVSVDVPLISEKEMSSFLTNLEKTKDIDAFDEAISAATEKLHEHCQRRDFFLGFSQSPAEFINALLASQARDLKFVSGDTYLNTVKESRSVFYNQPWIEDAVVRYLNRKPPVSSEPPGSK